MKTPLHCVPDQPHCPRRKSTRRAASALLLAALFLPAGAAEIQWQHLTSKNGDLPKPGESTQQTGAIVADFDRDGVNDFVLSFRQKAPALVWYRRAAKGWERYVIEKD